MHLPVYAKLKRISIEAPACKPPEDIDGGVQTLESNTYFTRRSIARSALDNGHKLSAWSYGSNAIITSACQGCGGTVTLYYRGTARAWVEHSLKHSCTYELTRHNSVS
jgi:hypothetical protein